MSDGEELLEFGRSPGPRWVRIAVAAVVVLAVGVLVAVQVWPRRTDRPQASPTTTPAYQIGPAIGPSGPTQPWPTAPEACGGDTDLAIATTRPLHPPTGVRLLVGGSTLRTVDFDSGRSTALAGLALRPGEYVLPASSGVAVTSTCSASGPNSGSRLVRIDGAGHATVGDIMTGPDTYLIVEGVKAWSVSLPDDPSGSAVLIPVGGGASLQLPAGFSPAAITGNTIVGALPATGSDSRDDLLVLVDASTGRVREQLGPGAFLTAGNGVVLWTVGCRISSGQPCTLNDRAIGGGPVHTYQLPRPPGFGSGVISPDGSLVAFLMERSGQDPRYDQGHPIPPGDVVIMHLDSGQIHQVPDLEVPAKSTPGLAFSADGSWLVMAFNAGATTRLLAWQPGLEQAYESTPVAGAGAGTPSVVALPA